MNFRKMETEFTKEQKYIMAKKRVKKIKGFYIHLAVFLAVNAFIVISRAISGEGISAFANPDTYGTFFIWGIVIVFHAFGVFGTELFFGKDWENKKIKELMEKDKRQFWE